MTPLSDQQQMRDGGGVTAADEGWRGVTAADEGWRVLLECTTVRLWGY